MTKNHDPYGWCGGICYGAECDVCAGPDGLTPWCTAGCFAGPHREGQCADAERVEEERFDRRAEQWEADDIAE